MNLADFQQRLSDRYTRLRDLRASENYPVYAIEHGFSPEEITTAMSLLGESYSAYNCITDAYWLVWTAAAAEVGYKYDGAEYWDTFRQTIPQWLDRTCDRNKIREFYRKFAATYHGLTPIGLWAKQFPIIAWPITQSILPKYLQRHFASHLFELRHELVKGCELTLEEIGDLLCNSYIGRSSLFEGFLQQKPLTSRIVMALSIEELADTVAPIEKPILDRIITDIDALGSIGRRLRETQRILRDARFINSYRPGFVSQIKLQEPSRELVADRTEGPRLIARPSDNDMWALSLSLPDLSLPLKSAGLTTRDMEQARMRFRLYSMESGWIPARALFGYKGDTEEPLTSYPAETVDVFTFDNPLEAATSVLESRLRLPAQEARLLKIRLDGSAYELSGRHVRSNHSYVIVTRATLPEAFIAGLGLIPLKVKTSSAYLWRLNVPTMLDAPKIAALASLGFGYRLGIRLQPVGLTPRWNATNDGISFIDTECPLFCISSEIDVREFLVKLDQSAPLRIVPSSDGATLISLGALSVGTHSLSVSALGVSTGRDMASEVLSIDVRSAAAWQSSIVGKAGVALKLEPVEATLDQFLYDAASLRVIAPPRRRLKLNAHFYGLNGELFREEFLQNYSTPLDNHKLSRDIAQKLGSEAQAVNVERAARIELAISLEELGSSCVAFEKPVEPIRWLRVDDRKVRLSDDTGDDTQPIVERFDLEAVNIATKINYEQALEGFELRGKGGLLVATYKEHFYEIIVTATKWTQATLKDLNIPTRVSGTRSTAQELITALKKWNSTRRLIGPLAPLARRNAIQSLERALGATLCGDEWVASIDRVLSGKQERGELYSRIWHSPGFASGLARFTWRYEADEPTATAEFIRLVEVYKLPASRSQCALALKLAFCPHTIKMSELPAVEMLTASCFERGLLRGAYFARMATDLRAQNTEAA